MALTRDFKETVAARVQTDPAFAQALLDEAIDLLVNGDPESSKLILRDLVNATVGFEALAEEVHKPAKSLHRMLSQQGNPTMSNISAVFAAVKRRLNVNAQEGVKPDLPHEPMLADMKSSPRRGRVSSACAQAQ
jgi:DNA-binding phage protein